VLRGRRLLLAGDWRDRECDQKRRTKLTYVSAKQYLLFDFQSLLVGSEAADELCDKFSLSGFLGESDI
jgi:hypothetical protein